MRRETDRDKDRQTNRETSGEGETKRKGQIESKRKGKESSKNGKEGKKGRLLASVVGKASAVFSSKCPTNCITRFWMTLKAAVMISITTHKQRRGGGRERTIPAIL